MDDTLYGKKCSACPIKFVKAHGHPVVCEKCFEDFGGETIFRKATLPKNMKGDHGILVESSSDSRSMCLSNAG